MSQINKEDVKQEVFDLYDDYAHNRLDRRAFVQKLSIYAVGGLTVPALMSFLMPDYKGNVQIKAGDPRLKAEYITYSSPKGGGTIKALLSKPIDAKKKLGGIVVVHENRGLNPYIEDVARRAALAGFITLAPDALSPLGGYPGNDDEGRTMQSKRNPKEMEEDFIAAFDCLKSNPDLTITVRVAFQAIKRRYNLFLHFFGVPLTLHGAPFVIIARVTTQRCKRIGSKRNKACQR